MKVYRLDKFTIPNNAREEFLNKIKEINLVLKSQPGFVQDFLLELSLNEKEFNLVTLVEWENAECIEGARSAVMALHETSKFNPQETMARLGIRAEMGTYKSINT